ncbi:sugar transferase [Fervidobacterium gondwanense]|uniref:sugar transferase n=1 Tax=Fervidobacterium gondwanense TaxID=44754 RepID=UPI003C79406E
MNRTKLIIFLSNLGLIYLISKAFSLSGNSSVFYFLILLLSYYSFRTYDTEKLCSFKSQFLSTTISATMVMLFFYMLDLLSIFKFQPQHVFSTLLDSSSIAALNYVFFSLIRKFTKPGKYIIIGKEHEYSEIVRMIEQEPNLAFSVSGYINPDLSQLHSLLPMSNGVLIGNLKFAKMIEKEFTANYSNKKIEYLPNFIEQRLKRIPLNLIEKYEQYYILEFSKPKDTLAIRLFDIFVSIVAIILTSPLWLVIALAILIEDGGPVIFKQKRAGKDGKLFTMYKFRSMRNLPQNDSQPKYPDQEKDRILKVGKIIRKYRLDELPQLINVLKGDMSIVGPRPEQKELHEIYSNANIPYYEYRLKVKPGITGWAQIAYQYSSSVDEAAKKLEYDLWYVKNKSFWLNAKIILKTPETMLFKRGAK